MRIRVLVSFVTLIVLLAAEPARMAADPVPADVLVFVDLSPSLVRQHGRLADIGGAVLRQVVPRGGTFAFYAMESSLADASTLLTGRAPAPVTTRQEVAAGATFARWEAELRTAFTKAVGGSKDQRRRFTSCYVKSAGFAGDYFRARPATPQRIVVWIGDLIEDCREDGYSAFRLGHVRGGRLQGSVAVPSLPGVRVVAVIVPRAPGDPAREVDAATVTTYWTNLGARLGLVPPLKIGTPEVLGLAPGRSGAVAVKRP